mmetsp:Transcript_40679/g.86553  ORF Transcript_40679/g.86553 Transcript_40679/m.86553 type:complete len:310 (-) Transcript_40679:2308-3237(-)
MRRPPSNRRHRERSSRAPLRCYFAGHDHWGAPECQMPRRSPRTNPCGELQGSSGLPSTGCHSPGLGRVCVPATAAPTVACAWPARLRCRRSSRIGGDGRCTCHSRSSYQHSAARGNGLRGSRRLCSVARSDPGSRRRYTRRIPSRPRRHRTQRESQSGAATRPPGAALAAPPFHGSRAPSPPRAHLRWPLAGPSAQAFFPRNNCRPHRGGSSEASRSHGRAWNHSKARPSVPSAPPGAPHEAQTPQDAGHEGRHREIGRSSGARSRPQSLWMDRGHHGTGSPQQPPPRASAVARAVSAQATPAAREAQD